jgi:hypothetical protein
MSAGLILAAYMWLVPHYIRPVPISPGRWKWVPCDPYGRLRTGSQS